MSDTYVVEVGPKGRVVIPAPLRRDLRLSEGTKLVALAEDGAVMLLPHSEVKARLRRIFADVEGSMASELIKERHAEARAESRR